MSLSTKWEVHLRSVILKCKWFKILNSPLLENVLCHLFLFLMFDDKHQELNLFHIVGAFASHNMMEKGLKSSLILAKETNKKKERISKSKATSSAAASMKFCVCAPPTHPDSFKCRLHRATASAHPRTGKYFCYVWRIKDCDKKHSIFRVLTNHMFCSSYQFRHQRQRRFAYVHPPPTLAHSSVAFTEPPLHLTLESTSATKKWFVTKKGSIFRVLTNHVFSFPSCFCSFIACSSHKWRQRHQKLECLETGHVFTKWRSKKFQQGECSWKA